MPAQSKSDAGSPSKVFFASLSSYIGAIAVAVLLTLCVIRLAMAREVPLRFTVGLGVGFALIATAYFIVYKELSAKAAHALLTHRFLIISLFISGGILIRFGRLLFEAASISAAEIALVFFGTVLGGLGIWWLRRLKAFGRNYWRKSFGFLTGKA